MKYTLFSILLICLCGQFNVNCGILGGMWNWVWGSGSSAQVPNEIALILAVEKNGRTYLANNQFITNYMNEIYDEFLFLCPAETAKEENINKYSKTQNVLFVREKHQNKDPQGIFINKDEISHKCMKPVMPSVINIGYYESYPDVHLYLVGYEVHFNDDPMSYHADDYHSAGLGDESFLWFNVYTIAFNRVKRSVVSVFSHSLAYRNNRMQLPMETNQDYSLGVKEFYENMEIYEIYEKKKQDEVFEKLFKDVPMPYPYLNSVQDRYLLPVHLADLDSFGIPILRQAGQTYGNMAPMWNFIYNNSWWNIEKQLDLLAQGLNAISIITGVYGTLEFSGREFYLGPENTVEVPAAFFKIVSYSPNNEEKYNMVIVTNNNPFVETDLTNEKICVENHCKNLGWEYFEQDVYGIGRTTCCPLTTKVLTTLKLEKYSQMVDKVLDLNQVPHWRNHRLTLKVKAYIVDQINGDNTDKLSDDNIYKNDEKLYVDREDEEITFSKFISTLYENYVAPYFSNMDVGIKIVETSSDDEKKGD